MICKHDWQQTSVCGVMAPEAIRVVTYICALCGASRVAWEHVEAEA